MGHEWAKGLLATLLLVGLVGAVIGVSDWRRDVTPRQESFQGLAQGLFEDWVFAFELLSILLLVALVGALYISRKRTESEEEATP